MANNVAKINLEINGCKDCPYVRNKPKYGGSYYCIYHGLNNPGLSVGEGDSVPDWCPFVLFRLEKVLEAIHDCSRYATPKKQVNIIRLRQRNVDPDPKFGADHTLGHIERVTKYGQKFLEDYVNFYPNSRIFSSDNIQKYKLLLRIAAELHDIGLADSAKNHAIHSAELAKKYLGSRVDIDERDAKMIVHAIYNHSKGLETYNFLDAALLLGDKLDITRERVVLPRNQILTELLKVKEVRFELSRSLQGVEEATLSYDTRGGFDITALRHWDKCISIPLRLTQDFLEIPNFRFLVDNKEVDLSVILG